MQETYEKLNKIFDLIRFIFICLTTFFGAIWLYCAVGLPSGWIYNSAINILPGIIRFLFHPTIESPFGQIDMSFMVLSVIFLILYFISSYLVKWTDAQAYKCELGNIERRKRLEKMVNDELEEENKRSIMEYDSSIVVIKLYFNYLIDPNIIEDRVDIEEIEKRSYTRLISTLNFPYQIKRGKSSNQAYFVIEKFWHIDHFIKATLKVIKEIYQENLKNDVKTSFTFAVDAVRSDVNFQNELKDLIKISSFQYKNKIVVTLPFVRRYDLKDNKIFTFRTMGTSRYFEKIDDPKSPFKFKTQDFELYYIKFQNKSN